jgi:hypothetical protein
VSTSVLVEILDGELEAELDRGDSRVSMAASKASSKVRKVSDETGVGGMVNKIKKREESGKEKPC